MLRPICFAFCLFVAAWPLKSTAQHLFPAMEKGKNSYGFIDTTGTFVHPPQYEDAMPFRNGYAVVKKNKKWGVVDSTNSTVVPLVYDDAHGMVSEGKVTVRKGDRWGVVSIKNEIVVPFQYDYLSIFNEGYVVGGSFVKSKSSSKTLDVVILGESRLFLDFGSYKLPGVITNGKNWSLGSWPVVRDGYITLLFDHSFDYDPLVRLDKSFHYLIPHNVKLGRPHQVYKPIRPGEAVSELPEFAAGFLPQVYDREVEDTVRDVAPWAPELDYYMDDQVVVGEDIFVAQQDNRGKDPVASRNYWQKLRPVILPRYELRLQRSNTTLVYHIQYNQYEPWQASYDYYAGDRVTYHGRIFESSMDSRNRNPTDREYWQPTSMREVDTTFVFNYVKSVGSEMTIPGASKYEYAGENSYLVSAFDTLQLLNEGWTYPLGVPASTFELEGARLSEGRLVARSSGRWGCFETNGHMIVPFEYDVIGDFHRGISLARKAGVYGFLHSSGRWKPLPSYNLVMDFTGRSSGR